MAQMLLKKPVKEEINKINGFIIKKSKKRLKNLLVEAIERSRLNRIFNWRIENIKLVFNMKREFKIIFCEVFRASKTPLSKKLEREKNDW